MQKNHYSLDQDYADRNGFVSSTSLLGGTIGFITSISSLVLPQASLSISLTLVFSIALFSLLGVALGIFVGYIIHGFFSVLMNHKPLRSRRKVRTTDRKNRESLNQPVQLSLPGHNSEIIYGA